MSTIKRTAKSDQAKEANVQNGKDRATPSYTPVQMRRAFEEVADQIRDQLVSGALRPGDRLPPERDLAVQFNLSRNTVREALRSLEIAGVLEFRKGATGGAFVREGQGDAVVSGFADLFRMRVIKPEHLTEARLIIGVMVARLACERATDEDLEKIQENVRLAEAAAAAGEVEKRIQMNMEFHRLLARATGNPVLIVLMDSLMEVQGQLLQYIPAAPENAFMPSRRKILKHLLARDEDKAAAEMESHLKALQRYYLNYLAQASKEKSRTDS